MRKSLAGMLFGSMMITAGGCVTNQADQRAAALQQRENYLLLQEDVRRVEGRLNSIDAEIQHLNQQLEDLSNTQNQALQTQLQGFNNTLDDLNRRIREVDVARQSDKQEIVNELSKKISGVMAGGRSQQRQAPRRAVSNEGYEHTVQTGETLSAIATAYGARIADIIQANDISNPDRLKVGQVLFIPAP